MHYCRLKMLFIHYWHDQKLNLSTFVHIVEKKHFFYKTVIYKAERNKVHAQWQKDPFFWWLRHIKIVQNHYRISSYRNSA